MNKASVINTWIKLIRGALVLLSVFLLFSCASKKALSPPLLEGEFSLIINVEGIVCCDSTFNGILRVGVYHDKAFWMSETGMVRGRIGMILDQTTQRVEIHGLPAGEYAIAVHQDQNGDGKMNRRFGLIPREPYGFSNNVGKYGPASFNKSAITLNSDKEITITLNNIL